MAAEVASRSSALRIATSVAIGLALAAVVAVLLVRRGERTLAPPHPGTVATGPAGDPTGPEAVAPGSLSAPPEETGAPPPAVRDDEPTGRREDLPATEAGGHLSGILVDEETDEPVPHFELRTRGETPETIVTDSAGRFRSRQRHPPGKHRIELIDVPGQSSPVAGRNGDASRLVELEVPARAEERVPIAVGPTYRLSLELPAHLRPGSLVGELSRIRATSVRFRAWQAPVRDGSPPWVRFAPVPDRALPGPPWALTLRSEDGLDSAEAHVQGIVGVHPERVRMVFARRSSLSGMVYRPDGAPAAHAGLTLRRDDGAILERVPLSTTADDAGAYRFQELSAGTYLLSTFLDAPSVERSFRRYYEYLRLPAGEEVVRDFHLRDPPSAGSVSGVLRSESGTYDTPVDITMTSARFIADGAGVTLQARATWIEQNGALEAPFLFEQVPEGEYSMAIWPAEDELWIPRSRKVRAPQTDVVFLHDDRPGEGRIAFRPVDGVTGEPVPSYWFFVEYGGNREVVQQGGPIASSGPCAVLPGGDVSLVWVVGAPGYRPSDGDRSSLPTGGEAGSEVVHDVALRPGWGMDLEIRGTTTDDRFPLEGVRVYVDGALAAVSDERGLARLQADHEPAEVRVDHEEWVYDSGILDPDTGRPHRFALRGPIGMRPRE